ncbi:ABC transporter permease [Xinfangfangia sp. D13-10-4-6]|uniref:ABC transporter permease n=1 Tax=Pseudogemmobacter hezensis TaxID=2737662 RepID=UPI0015545D15|nr:ABC transporter permease [Pseudogemmobacter hezensis]NPD17458.1 ABC transporter permease [Pseudogemmobacter hezensis]
MLLGPVTATLAKLWLISVLVIAIGAPWLAPWDYTYQQPLLRLSPPALFGGDSPFWLGSDHLGRDTLSRSLYAMRFSLIVAIIGTLTGAAIGILAGMVAARRRGVLGEAIMAAVDIQASLPFLIFAIVVVGVFGKSFWLIVLIIGIAGWERYARLVRGLVLDAETHGYAGALRVVGAGTGRIYLHHVLPNILGVLMVQMTLNFPESILLETSLSFLGLGVQPPMTSLGLMISESRNYIVNAPWMAAVPSLLILLTTLAFVVLGDNIRDRVARD